METILTAATVPTTEQPLPTEEARIHFKDEHLQEPVKIPREPHPRFPRMNEPVDEVTMGDIPGYITGKLGHAIAEGRLHTTLAHFEKIVGAQELIGDDGLVKLRDLSRRAHEHRFDPEMTRRIGSEAQEFTSNWRVIKKPEPKEAA